MKAYLATLISLVLFLSACNDEATVLQTQRTKPNVILIMTDDQGWGDLSLHGNTNLDTPNIDSLALNGVSFQNFYVQPVCSPTRAELLTGRYSGRLGVHATSKGGERMNLGETTVAEIFKDAGYQTAAYGKWHNGMQPPYHPNSRGFDDYYGFTSGHWGSYFSPMLEHNGALVKGNGFLVDDLTDKGLEFISKNQEAPFFLYLPYNTPHSPMQVPDAYWNRFVDKALIKKYHGSQKENENHTKAALAMVENIDYNVGRITQKLKELQLEERTIVIYLSDNGPNGWRWNGDMRGRKGSTDEGGVRSPFFVQWKNTLPKGLKIEQIAGAIDILPTLTSLANIEPKTQKPLDGKNLEPLMLDSKVSWEPRTIYNHWRGRTSLRTQKYRLDHENRLYDMIKDHGQTQDISAQFPALADSLKAEKRKWLDQMQLLNWENDERPITLGFPGHPYTQIPARDGIAHGNIKRSNQHPNNTFFTHWTSTKDSINWDTEVLADGDFEVTLYYTCKEENIGAKIQLKLGDSRISTIITETHDPPLTGMENDRDPRIESYVKDFKPLSLGNISFKKGRGALVLKRFGNSWK